MESREDHVLPLLSVHDVLDKSLYISPRFKKSRPLIIILSESYQDKERHRLPKEFQRLISQFMIANRYVFKAAHLSFQGSLFESLLSRLDLHPDSNNFRERVVLKQNVKRVEQFINYRSKTWQKEGHLHQRYLADRVVEVTFAKGMLEWISPSYQGKMTMPPMPQKLTTPPSQRGLELVVDKVDEEEVEEEGEKEGVGEGEEEGKEEKEELCLTTKCLAEVEAATQDLISEHRMTQPRNGSEEVGSSDKMEVEAKEINSYLKYEDKVRAAVEDMLSELEVEIARRQKRPLLQVCKAGGEQQEEEKWFTQENKVRAMARDTITDLESNSSLLSGSVGSPLGHSIYQDGKYPVSYRNILLLEKNQASSSSTTSQPRRATSLISIVTSNSTPSSVQEGIDPTIHGEKRPPRSQAGSLSTPLEKRQRMSLMWAPPSNSSASSVQAKKQPARATTHNKAQTVPSSTLDSADLPRTHSTSPRGGGRPDCG